MSVRIELAVVDPSWVALGDLKPLVESAVAAALAEDGTELGDDTELSCLFCDDQEIRRLNRRWRNIDTPTNVLSFPAAGPEAERVLGDIAIAFGTVEREAADEGKPIRAHLVHLLVHGVLHLLGHDHGTPAEAEGMEAVEVRALDRLGIADPYAGSEPAGCAGP